MDKKSLHIMTAAWTPDTGSGAERTAQGAAGPLPARLAHDGVVIAGIHRDRLASSGASVQ